MAARLQEEYKKTIVPKLLSEGGFKNTMQVPRITKIVVNIGMGEMANEKDLIEKVRDELAIITGQRPVLRKSSKAISNFKVRQGSPVGYKVTLRGSRMYEFLDRLVNFAIPRIRDFRGLSRNAFDQKGNYAIGIKEQTIFPELDLDKIPKVHGMDVCIVMTAGNKENAIRLLEAFGMPFTRKSEK